MIKKCYVFIYRKDSNKAVPAGLLEFDDQTRQYFFRYGKKYCIDTHSIPIDINLLPLSLGQNRKRLDADYLGVIRDSSPDFWGRLVIEKMTASMDMEEIDYLLFHNALRVGNLDFRENIDSPEPMFIPPDYTELPELLITAEAVEKGAKLTSEQERILPLLRQGSSLGGARPKSTILMDGDLWLAKFPSYKDTWSNARIEASTMTLANKCGISIPEISVQIIYGKEVFFIKRFDRYTFENKICRRGYMSALSALCISDSDFSNFSYISLADFIRKNNPSELLQLFKRVAFNIICRNTDDHPRNHGFCVDNGTVSLSPAFDITPTKSLEGLSTTAYLSMKIGDYGKETTLDNLISQCGHFGITSDDATYIFTNMIDIVSDSWRNIFADFSVSDDDMEEFAYTFSRWERSHASKMSF